MFDSWILTDAEHINGSIQSILNFIIISLIALPDLVAVFHSLSTTQSATILAGHEITIKWTIYSLSYLSPSTSTCSFLVFAFFQTDHLTSYFSTLFPMSSLTILFFSTLFFTAITEGCAPNFAGAALTLSTATDSWSAKANGFPIVDYTVKTVESTNFTLELSSGAPAIGNTDPSDSNVNQKWMVDSMFCTLKDISLEPPSTVVTSGCSITSTTNKLCVMSGTPMTLVTCASSEGQRFYIKAAKAIN
ncbi:hypothetical protein EV421DRAFT_1906743 [Armillaria borealis]|uniref:Uncharacterized protein n=1 Tax=Armillaria borealis TaxID=47425 RepID=A0AA39J8P8_9AGAR|nr:hypothetical protein EV421DRAFT_1906743 [Armillaria borealis]